MPAILAHWAIAKEVAKTFKYSMNPNYVLGNENERYDGFSKYLFLGANGPDLPYFEHLVGDDQGISPFADLYHYNKQGEFIINYVRILKQISDVRILNQAMPYILGHTSHLIADSIMHPFVNRFAGVYHKQPVEDLHKISELHQDSWLAQKYFGRRQIDEGDSWTEYIPENSSDLDNILNTIDIAYNETYNKKMGLERLQTCHSKFYHVVVDMGYDASLSDIPEEYDETLINHKYVQNSELIPEGFTVSPEEKSKDMDILYYKLLKSQVFNKASQACQSVINLFESDFSEEMQNYFRHQIKNWNMDTGYWIDVSMKDGKLNINWKHTWCP